MSNISSEVTPLIEKVVNEGYIEVLERKLPSYIRREIEDEDIEDLLYEEEDFGGKLADVPEWTTREIIISIFSGVTVILSILSMYFLPSDFYVYDIFSILSIFIPIYSAYQEQKVTEAKVTLKAMRKYKEKMIHYNAQNEKMENKIEEMKERTSKLGTLKNTLEELREMESTAIDQLEKSMVCRQELTGLNQITLFAEIVDNIIDILLRVDENQDMLLCEEETDAVIKAIEGINDVDINDEHLRQKIKEYGNSVEGVMRLMNDVFDESPSVQDYLEQ